MSKLVLGAFRLSRAGIWCSSPSFLLGEEAVVGKMSSVGIGDRQPERTPSFLHISGTIRLSALSRDVSNEYALLGKRLASQAGHDFGCCFVRSTAAAWLLHEFSRRLAFDRLFLGEEHDRANVKEDARNVDSKWLFAYLPMHECKDQRHKWNKE